MKVVLDANIYVSSLITRKGNAQKIIEYWQGGRFELLISADILAEVSRVLRYPKIVKIHKQSDEQITRFIELLAKQATLIIPSKKLSISSDEPDNRYIECAIEGNANYLVTGDKKHLLPLKSYQGVPIIPPAAFLVVLEMSK